MPAGHPQGLYPAARDGLINPSLLFSPCFLCLDPSHPRFQGKLLLRTLVSALMSSTQTLAKVTPPAPPARLVYFLGLIASVVLSPAYFVSLVPSSSPPFLSFFTTSCRRTGTLSCSSAQTRVSQPQDNGHFGSEPPLFGGLSSSLQEVEQHPWPPPTRCLTLTLWMITKCGKFLEMDIPNHLTCLLRNLYAGQETTVRIGHGTMD